METRRSKGTNVREFARHVILSKEYQSTLKRRVLLGEVSPDLARTLLGYARSPEPGSPESLWLDEPPVKRALESIANADAERKE